MNWNEALKMMKQGAAMRRENWSGGKFIFYVNEMTLSGYGNYPIAFSEYAKWAEIAEQSHWFTLVAHIAIHTKGGKFGYYATTQCDMLANDWVKA